MASPSESLSNMAKVAAAIALGLTALFFVRSKSPQPPPMPPVPSASALPSASTPTVAPSAYYEAEIVPETWLPTPPAPTAPPQASQAGTDALVKLAGGRWQAEGGAKLHIDPPRAAKGRQTRFHLVLEREDRSGFGCDFDVAREGAELSGYDGTYRAWCGGEAKGRGRSVLGLRLDGRKLHVGLLVDAKMVVEQTFSR